MFNNLLKEKEFKKRVLFVGIPDMAYICLDVLNSTGVNIVGVVGPKKNHGTYSYFKNFVNDLGLNFIEYDKLDTTNFINKIKDLNADIAVVCSFNYRVPKILLDTVKDGFINVHPSLLPKYRGPNPYSTVIANNEKETGVTLHFMDENFDTGDIISQKKLPISDVETMGTLFNRLNILAIEMLLETLKIYEKTALNVEKQTKGNFTKGSNYSEKELTLDYSKPAKELERFIRALNPFILPRTIFRGTLTKILSAEVILDDIAKDKPFGSIAKIEDDKFYIVTGHGLLAITSMQVGSLFVGTSKDFIKILNPKIGEKFS